MKCAGSSRIKAVVAITLATSVVASTLVAAPAYGKRASPVGVQLVSLTDFHGQLKPGDQTMTDSDGKNVKVGGAAYLAAHLKRLRSGHENSVLFSSGDNFTGLTRTAWSANDEPTIEVMNKLGLDFSTVGNHELDVGRQMLPGRNTSRTDSRSFLIDHMMKGKCFGKIGLESCFTDSTGSRFHGADFDYLTGNVVRNNQREHIFPGTKVKWVKDGRSTRRLPVGFINLTVPATQDAVAYNRSFHPGLDSLPIVKTANAEAKRLHQRGVNAVVLNVHQGASAGAGYDACNSVKGPMMDANDKLSPDIDAIVTGHYHKAFNCQVKDPAGNPRPLVEAASRGRAISEINLRLSPDTGKVRRHDTTSTIHAVDHDIKPDPAMQRIVDYWGEKVSDTRGIPIAKIANSVTGVRTAAGESALGDLIADAYQKAGNKRDSRSDLAVAPTEPQPASSPRYADDLTTSRLHAGNPSGVITAGEAWNAVDTHDPVVTVSISGAQLKKALEQQWQTDHDAADDQGAERFVPLAVSHNLSYSYDRSKPVGRRINPAKIVVNGAKLRPGRYYRVTAPILTAFGQGGFSAFKKAIRPARHARQRDILRWYLSQQRTIRAPATDRVSGMAGNPIKHSGTSQLSDRKWALAFSGWKSVSRDAAVGGDPLRLDGKTHDKGLGMAAPGEVMYNLDQRCTRLTATVGVDDYMRGKSGGTATFEVYADGKKVFDSGVLHAGKSADVDVSLSGASTLQLRVTSAGDGWHGDRGDWVNPKLSCE